MDSSFFVCGLFELPQYADSTGAIDSAYAPSSSITERLLPIAVRRQTVQAVRSGRILAEDYPTKKSIVLEKRIDFVMSLIFTLFIVYGVVLIGGGLVGYAKAKSQASLISGIVTGLLAFGVAALRSQPRLGLICGLVLAFAVGAIFSLRYVRTRKAMPAIPLFVLSDLLGIACVLKLIK